jgi:hypothetical protein
MVLLPQYAPYTAPMGILVCGGSTSGPGSAIDNCVSTQPEAAAPTWTIERMVSSSPYLMFPNSLSTFSPNSPVKN